MNRLGKRILFLVVTTVLLTGCSSAQPTAAPTSQPAPQPTAAPTSQPAPQPTAALTSQPAPQPTAAPTSLPAPTPAAAEVAIQNFAFNPAQLTVKVGTTVTWTNKDTVAHTVTADDGSWGSGNFAQGATYTHTFDTAGTVAYHCAVHPSMKGTIVVTP